MKKNIFLVAKILKEFLFKDKLRLVLIFVFLILVLVFVTSKDQLREKYKTDYQKTNLDKKVEIETDPNVLRFGFMTDVHTYSNEVKNKKKEVISYRLSRRAQEGLFKFKEEMNGGFNPDFVIENGDFIDGGDWPFLDMQNALRIFNQVKAPRYHVLGNHELRVMKKKDWTHLFAYEKPYYYFDEKDFRMIVLDANTRIFLDGSERQIEPEFEFYPGYVDREQMAWLEDLLEKSKDKEFLVFVHQPLINKSEVKTELEIVRDGEKVRNLFSAHGVRAVFSGHIEEQCYQDIDGVKYFTFPGFHKKNGSVAKKDQYFGVFVKVWVAKDNIKLEMFYKASNDKKEKYQTKFVEQDENYCNNTIFK